MLSKQNWRIAFKICVAIFSTAFAILIIAVIFNWYYPDVKFNTPDFMSDEPSVKQLIQLFKTIDIADFYVTIFSFVASVVTFIGKR